MLYRTSRGGQRRRRFLSLLGSELVGGIEWLLKDDFTDTRAAGAVGGTPATPGPGDRDVVTDTNLKISVGSDVLDFATGAVSNDGVWFEEVLRELGRLLLVKMSFANTNGKTSFAFDENQSGAIIDGFRFNTGDILIRPTEATIEVGLYTATTYYAAVIMRSSGMYYFIKGGIFTNWTLLYSASLDTESRFPCLTTTNTVTISNFDFIRIPLQTWLPTPIGYDTFTRADGAIGSTEATGPDGQQAPVKAWTNNVGTTAVVSNKIVTSALDGGIAISTLEAGTAEIDLGIDLVRGSATAGLTTNYVDVNNRIFTEHDGTNLTVVKVVAGTPTPLIDIAATYSAGAIVNIKTYISGGALKLRAYYNNVFIGTEQTISDAALIAATKHGWYATDTDSTGDNFTLFARGQNDTSYAALNRFIK